MAGETSGDAYGALLARELRRHLPTARIWGLGSTRMAAQGVELLADSRSWAAIGIVQSLRVAPQLALRVLPRLRREIRHRRPALLVAIDFGAFNVPVCRWARQRGIRVLYYLPPGSWRRSGPPPTKLAEATDAVATQFPWSEEGLRLAGANVTFVGHPLLDLIGPQPSRDAFLHSVGLASDAEVIALLPGSRVAELAHNPPAMAEAAIAIHARRPHARFVVALADEGARHVADAGFARLARVQAAGEPIMRTVVGQTHAVLAHASAAMVCSGTATLEAAILGTPMVVLYRGSRLMYAEYVLRRISRIQWIALPNIIAGRTIVPEFVAQDATPDNLAAGVLHVLEDRGVADEMRQGLAEVRGFLGEPGATRRTAQLALNMLAGTGSAAPQV